MRVLAQQAQACLRLRLKEFAKTTAINVSKRGLAFIDTYQNSGG
jgi:hypothetical protein